MLVATNVAIQRSVLITEFELSWPCMYIDIVENMSDLICKADKSIFYTVKLIETGVVLNEFNAAKCGIDVICGCCMV